RSWTNTSRNAEVPAGKPAGTSVVLNVGGDLLSHTLASAVPSALEGLASGFGMGPGVPPPPTPPTTLSNYNKTWLCAQGHTVDASNKMLWASPRPISTGRLHPSQSFHPRPINP